MGFVDAVSRALGLGLEPKDLTLLQVSFRGLIVFVAALVMLRMADRRFIAKLSAFDAILGLILASVLARAVNGSASFFPTLAVSFLLVLLHRFLALAACRWPLFGRLIKGQPEVLVRQGKAMPGAMRKHNISKADLLEEVRLNGDVSDLTQVHTATLERNGEISVVTEE